MVRDKGAKKATGIMGDNQGNMEVGQYPVDEDNHGYGPDSGKTGPELTQGGNRAFEGRDTQPTSRSRGGAIYKPSKGAKFVGQSINAQGNELALRKTEPGRKWVKIEGADRPAGTSTARFGSGVRPLEPINAEDHLPTSNG